MKNESDNSVFLYQKRRWAGWWSLYWCFGSYKHHKRIGDALLNSEAVAQVPAACYVENPNRTATTITLPFIAPPSSPASYLPSDSALLSLSSLSVHANSPGMTAHIFLIGPYAHETQLVSPPVYSTFTTEPSTASFTPPPEPAQMTTPSSPEAPFAQLLSSSLLAQRCRNTGNNPRSQCDSQPYQYHIKSPVSAISTSGTSSPFFDKRANIEFLRMVEAPKFVGYEHFMNYTWGSRVGSGSMTPNGWGSRLGSGVLTPNGAEPPSQDSDNLVDHRVSFELTGGDTPTCIVKETIVSPEFWSATIQEAAQGTKGKDLATEVAQFFRTQATVKTDSGRDLDGEVKEWGQKHGTISVSSSKDFNFNTKNEVASKDLSPQKNWTFFPMLESGVS